MSLELTNYESYSPSSDLGPYRAADYWALPEGEPCELLHGRLIASPSPTALHQIVCLLLSEHFLKVARRSGGIAFAAPMDVILSDDSIVQPDILYIGQSRISIVQDRVLGAPDLVVEVLSSEGSRRDRAEKLDLYASSGVPEYWVVDPKERQIDFLINQGGRFEIQLARDECYQSAKLNEVQIDLADFWREVDARLP